MPLAIIARNDISGRTHRATDRMGAKARQQNAVASVTNVACPRCHCTDVVIANETIDTRDRDAISGVPRNHVAVCCGEPTDLVRVAELEKTPPCPLPAAPVPR